MMLYRDGLRGYILSESDWELIEELQKFFAPFVNFQKKMSAQKYLMINRATTLYNMLFNHLENYTRSNSTPVYAISQALDPRCHYSWWSYVGWLQDWIENAKKQVEDEWAKYVPVSSQQQEPSFDADYNDYKLEDIKEDALAAYVAERHQPRQDVTWQYQQGQSQANAASRSQFLDGYSSKFTDVFEEEKKKEKQSNNEESGNNDVEFNILEEELEEVLEEI
ncbi:hypothetical protein BDA99DRAFT_566803 [Phascolomyces articulosus]|uniref:HAT C-terminal dimerisation domain-containing protein n=1 Tax=Phascolomyces articulosus TaxID=60185 RepID=A0AAD5JVR6_9FUNG|nr:hypothetical protein BDA99DRAFT_566803 [Phascolomyces articulosus]